MSDLLFVFGTLKEGFPNFAANMGARVPGNFVTAARFPLYLVGERHSPWLINSPGQGEFVHGQVFEVSPQTLKALDRLERVDEPDGYERASIQVHLVDSNPVQSLDAFAYLKHPRHLAEAKFTAGPLGEYTLVHASQYRKRGAFPSTGPVPNDGKSTPSSRNS